jgi:hypothetical protein
LDGRRAAARCANHARDAQIELGRAPAKNDGAVVEQRSNADRINSPRVAWIIVRAARVRRSMYTAR